MFAPQGADFVSEEVLFKAQELAREKGTFVYMHLSQGDRETKQMMMRYGKRTVDFLEERNLLDDRLIGIHPVSYTHLIETAKQAFFNGITFAKEGYRLSDISNAVQKTVEGEGFGVIRDFVGHGIGSSMHEDPQIPNYGKPGKGPRLQRGMVLAIEPMICQGSYEAVSYTHLFLYHGRVAELAAGAREGGVKF